jgi:hypothetical protein
LSIFKDGLEIPIWNCIKSFLGGLTKLFYSLLKKEDEDFSDILREKISRSLSFFWNIP